MLKLSDLTPINLDSEKEKFFASNFKYNPQFVYENRINQTELTGYGKPKLWYLFLAKRILKKLLKEDHLIKSEEQNRHFLDQDSVEDLIEKRLLSYNLNQKWKVVFSHKFVSRISVNNKYKTIKVRLPIIIDKNEIESILNHEIDTHVLRQVNYEKQLWFKKKTNNSFRPYLKTEEGLAAINELVANKNKLAYKSAINYLAVDLALKNDFVTVFNFFYKIWHDSERSWTWTLKKKRGVSDTSKKGGYTKDLVYFEGLVEVLNYLKKNGYSPAELYYGKLDLKDIQKAKKLNQNQEEIILPKVFTQNPKAYKEAIMEIAKINQI